MRRDVVTVSGARVRAMFGASWAALLLLAAVPATGRAQATELTPVARRVSLVAELGYFGDVQQSSRLHVVSLHMFGEYAFDDRWSLAGDLGAVMLRSSPELDDGDTAVRPGNPALMVQLRERFGPADLVFGLGGAAPLAVIETGAAGRMHHTAYNRVQGMHGLWDLWLWAPSRGAVVGLGRVGLAATPWLRVSAEVEPALMIPAREAFGYRPVELLVPVAASAAATWSVLTPGLRVQAVLMTMGRDPLQLSIEPWLRWALGASFVELSYTACVGEPLVGERGPGSWGLHLGAGGTL